MKARGSVCGLVLALLCNLPLAAANLDTLVRGCASGVAGTCAKLAELAQAPGDESARRAAAEGLIRAKSHNCTKTGQRTEWRRDQPVRIESQYLFAHDLPESRRAEIARAGDQLVGDAMQALEAPTKAAGAVVEVTVFGAAKAWLFGAVALDGPMRGGDSGVDQVLYPDADWKGVISVRLDGRCVCAETFRSEVQRRGLMIGGSRRKPSDAPFRRDLRRTLAPVLVRIGKDLYGEDAIRSLATGANDVQIREEALAQLRDPAALAAVLQNDSSDLMRWTAVGKVNNQGVLAGAALRDKSPAVRLAAVQRLSDTACLAEVARTDPDPSVRKQAQVRLGKVGRTQ